MHVYQSGLGAAVCGVCSGIVFLCTWLAVFVRMMVMANSMTASDLCSMYKPWALQKQLVEVIMEEFWLQVRPTRIRTSPHSHTHSHTHTHTRTHTLAHILAHTRTHTRTHTHTHTRTITTISRYVDNNLNHLKLYYDDLDCSIFEIFCSKHLCIVMLLSS